MTIILAADMEWAIGKDGGLLARLPEDMKSFRAITKGHTIVMGRKTYESFPKRPLPERENCVISRSVKELSGAKVFGSIEDFLEYAKTKSGEIFVCGGGEIYRALLPYCDRVLLTRTWFDGKADRFFPDLDALPQWRQVCVSKPVEENGVTFQYIDYVNQNVAALESDTEEKRQTTE